jgi:hypothetical protein
MGRKRRRVHACAPTKQTKGKGMLMFFAHLSTGHKGIVCAMAMEPIPVRATFAKPVSSVTVSFWGSTGTPALLEAFDTDGKVVESRQSGIRSELQGPRRSGPSLHYDREGRSHRLHPVFKLEGKRIGRCG